MRDPAKVSDTDLTADEEQMVIFWADSFRQRILKDLFVLAMARATPNRPGARKRAFNAAYSLLRTVRRDNISV